MRGILAGLLAAVIFGRPAIDLYTEWRAFAEFRALLASPTPSPSPPSPPPDGQMQWENVVHPTVWPPCCMRSGPPIIESDAERAASPEGTVRLVRKHG